MNRSTSNVLFKYCKYYSAAATRSLKLGAGQIQGSGAAVAGHTPRGGGRAV